MVTAAATNPFDLSGRLALVTGSSGGLGFAIAQGLANAGARVVLNGRDRARLDQAGAALRDAGHDAHAEPFDVTDTAAVAAALARIEGAVGAIDILVNNAGVNLRKPLARRRNPRP